MITYDEAVLVLRKLKGNAESFDRNEDSVFADYREVASYDMREIIETLLRLDLNGEILGPGGIKEGPLVGALRMLRDSAVIFDKYEDDVIEDYRNWAESEKRDIIERLLELELDGKCLEVDGNLKGKMDGGIEEENAHANSTTAPDYYNTFGETHAFDTAIGNCEWVIEQAKELKALLSYRSGRMIELNGVRATSAISSIRDALGDIEEFILGKEMQAARPLGTVLENAVSRAGKDERNLGEKDMGIG